jgi:hypothetical protein
MEAEKLIRRKTKVQLAHLESEYKFTICYSPNKKVSIMHAIYNGKYHEQYATDPIYAIDVANYYRFVFKGADYLQFYMNSLDGEFKSYAHYYIATHYMSIGNMKYAIEHLTLAVEFDNNPLAHQELAMIALKTCFTGFDDSEFGIDDVFPKENVDEMLKIEAIKKAHYHLLTSFKHFGVNTVSGMTQYIMVVNMMLCFSLKKRLKQCSNIICDDR